MPPVVTISPANPSASARSAPATVSTPSATTWRSTTSNPATVEPFGQAAPDRSSRVPATTPSDTVSTLACSITAGRPQRGCGAAAASAGVGGAEDGAAGHEHVGAGLGRDRRGPLVDASVDLDGDVEALVVDHLACPADLRHHLVHERLAAEAGVHGHEQQQVDLVEVRLGRLERRLGVDGQADVEAEVPHLVDQLAGVAHLDVHRAAVGPGLRNASR